MNIANEVVVPGFDEKRARGSGAQRTALAIAGCLAFATSCGSIPDDPRDFIEPTSTTLPEIAPPGFTSKFADVNGARLHYFAGGQGSPVVLLHGFAETAHMWRPLMPELAKHHTVIAPDLRGAGESDKPQSGYDKLNMAADIHALTTQLGLHDVTVVGHDIGMMVAYAYAARYPTDTERVVLMDAFLPGIGNWHDMFLLRDLWHFHFYGETPLALVKGRERTYFEHFWNDFAADRHHSVPEADRRFYTEQYARPDGMRAGFEYFRAFESDATDFAALGAHHLTMPMLVLAGEKSGGTFLADQVRLVADDVQSQVVPGVGHWLMEEAPATTMQAILQFVDGVAMEGAQRPG